jgi:hypothetical protein
MKVWANAAAVLFGQKLENFGVFLGNIKIWKCFDWVLVRIGAECRKLCVKKVAKIC